MMNVQETKQWRGQLRTHPIFCNISDVEPGLMYSVMQLDGNSFGGDVAVDSINMACSGEDSFL